MRAAVDTGGTFTDLVLEDEAGRLSMHKSATTPDDPVEGVLGVLTVAAAQRGESLEELLAAIDLFIHGTTRATNAVIVGSTARTAFITTQGHRDILLFREGGRPNAFDYGVEYPAPYVPRALTFEIPERVGQSGKVVRALDRAAGIEVARKLSEQAIEAVGVCLLWSVVNPIHELAMGNLLDEHLPGIPYTLSHQLNPIVREYRRASSAVIDASLKPLMSDYLSELEGNLREAGFGGRLLMVTSNGGVLDLAAVAEAPIHSIGSGPAMAPVAGQCVALREGAGATAIVVDTGGTSYDISLVRHGRIPRTQEAWLGERFVSPMTGFPSVDVRSIGAGGGSIARVDDGGLLHVGPESAGAVPGPACYRRGGVRPTVTDACLALGYIDPEYFLGGAMGLDPEAAREALEQFVGAPLRLDHSAAAAAIVKVVTEHMAHAIEEVTLEQGVDPRDATIVAGGGAAGLNAVAIARRLDAPLVILPRFAPALSAAGGLLSDLIADFAATLPTSSTTFDFDAVQGAIGRLTEDCRGFIEAAGASSVSSSIEFYVEARYPHQIWDLDVPLARTDLRSAEHVQELCEAFHSVHREVFAIADERSPVEMMRWRARASCRLASPIEEDAGERLTGGEPSQRRVHFDEIGAVDATILHVDSLVPSSPIQGPAIVESPLTTVVLNPGAVAHRSSSGALIIRPQVDASIPTPEPSLTESELR